MIMLRRNPDLETGGLFPSCYWESRQKRDKVRDNLIGGGEIASLPAPPSVGTACLPVGRAPAGREFHPRFSEKL